MPKLKLAEEAYTKTTFHQQLPYLKSDSFKVTKRESLDQKSLSQNFKSLEYNSATYKQRSSVTFVVRVENSKKRAFLSWANDKVYGRDVVEEELATD